MITSKDGDKLKTSLRIEDVYKVEKIINYKIWYRVTYKKFEENIIKTGVLRKLKKNKCINFTKGVKNILGYIGIQDEYRRDDRYVIGLLYSYNPMTSDVSAYRHQAVENLGRIEYNEDKYKYNIETGELEIDDEDDCDERLSKEEVGIIDDDLVDEEYFKDDCKERVKESDNIYIEVANNLKNIKVNNGVIYGYFRGVSENDNREYVIELKSLSEELLKLGYEYIPLNLIDKKEEYRYEGYRIESNKVIVINGEGYIMDYPIITRVEGECNALDKLIIDKDKLGYSLYLNYRYILYNTGV